MKVLVVNCGSSSIKYQLINMENEASNGERILRKNRNCQIHSITHTVNGEKHSN